MSELNRTINETLSFKGFTKFLTDSRSYLPWGNFFSLFGGFTGLGLAFVLLFIYQLFQTPLERDIGVFSLALSPLFIFITVVLTLGFMGLLGSIAVFLSERVNVTESQLLDVKDKSETDPLSGLCNRRSFMRMMDTELHRQSRLKNQGEMALIFIDIDHFKLVNDTYGHHAGDIVIQLLSKFLEQACRPYDTVARWGGEEIVILTPQTSEDQSVRFAERIRSGIEALDIDAEGQIIPITISIGVALYLSNGEEMNEFIDRADSMLYKAKNCGRNRVEISLSNETE